MKLRKTLQAGMSLVEVMVVVGVMSIVALGLSQMLVSQQREVDFLSKKQELTEFRAFLADVLRNQSYCNWQLKAATTTTPINTSGTTSTIPSSTAVNINTFYAGPNAASPIIFSNGQFIDGLSSRIKAGGIKLSRIVKTGFPDEYKGILEFSISPEGLPRSVRPINHELIFRVDPADPANAKTIVKCCFDNSCPPPPMSADVSLSCHAGNNSSATCHKDLFTELNLGAYGISPSDVKLTTCRITSYADDGHSWGGHPANTLNYSASSYDLSLSVNQAYVTVSVHVDWSGSATTFLAPGYTCSF